MKSSNLWNKLQYGVWSHTVTSQEAASSCIYVDANAFKNGARYIIPVGCTINGSGTTLAPFCDWTNNVIVVYGMFADQVLTINYIAVM